MVALSGCLGTGLLEGPDDSNNDGNTQSGGSSGGSDEKKDKTGSDDSDAEQTPESTPEPTPEPTPEDTTESLEDRITFTRDEDDPEVVGTLLLKGDIPGVIVSTDYESADAWQNYAKVDDDTGAYKVGLSVTSTASIGRLSVVGTVYDADGEVVGSDKDVSNNIPAGEKALIHLAFEGDISQMYYFEISLVNPA
ncbi:FxLYD domain-containing protein (plasmid) [Haloferax sp. S1W]|uniref:FxLYD domain-containing protein n=1 Tax=Haloferax sp. S1W TaxID=3377110 RepID=UPI0037C70CCB